ncbi:MAG: hypothetical protein ACRDY7_16025, partial [Acidimicrobiia bacterium]
MRTDDTRTSVGPPTHRPWRWPWSSWPALALPAVLAVFALVGSAGAADNQPDREPLDVAAVALLLT